MAMLNNQMVYINIYIRLTDGSTMVFIYNWRCEHEPIYLSCKWKRNKHHNPDDYLTPKMIHYLDVKDFHDGFHRCSDVDQLVSSQIHLQYIETYHICLVNFTLKIVNHTILIHQLDMLVISRNNQYACSCLQKLVNQWIWPVWSTV